MKKLFNSIGIIAVLAILLPILSGCSDDKEEPVPVGCTFTRLVESVTGVKGKVISTSDGYYILPIEPVAGISQTDTLSLILAKKKDVNAFRDRLDLSKYKGQNITFDCEMCFERARSLMTIDEKEVIVFVYLAQNLIIKDNKSRSDENTDGLFHCGTEVSEESYNFISERKLERGRLYRDNP